MRILLYISQVAIKGHLKLHLVHLHLLEHLHLAHLQSINVQQLQMEERAIAYFHSDINQELIINVQQLIKLTLGVLPEFKEMALLWLIVQIQLKNVIPDVLAMVISWGYLFKRCFYMVHLKIFVTAICLNVN